MTISINVLKQNQYTDHPYQTDPEVLHLLSTTTESGTMQKQHVVCPIHHHDTVKYLHSTSSTLTSYLRNTINTLTSSYKEMQTTYTKLSTGTGTFLHPSMNSWGKGSLHSHRAQCYQIPSHHIMLKKLPQLSQSYFLSSGMSNCGYCR